ncbi:AAA family ATPase [Porticoccus sp.]
MYYEAYFELQEAPFSISPDPRYLYLTQNHREALAHLLYGVSSNGGFVLLTGEIGAGKTTVCQCLLEQLPDNSDVAYILNPKLEPWEFLATICDELGIHYSEDDTSLKHYIDLIHRYLLEAHGKGRNTVLMVDEAQNLSTELIEHLRLLTNLETREKKLLQIMLVGQPELRDKIALPEMQQMAQRITARYHLGPLTKPEVAAYVRHRLKVAGAPRELFSRESLNQLWKYTGGVPRLINIICDRALLGTYTSKAHRVERPVLEDAAAEVLGRQARIKSSRSPQWIWASAAVLLAALAFAAAYYSRELIPGRQQLSWVVPVQSADQAVAPSRPVSAPAAMQNARDIAGDDPGTPNAPPATPDEAPAEVVTAAVQDSGAEADPPLTEVSAEFPQVARTPTFEGAAVEVPALDLPFPAHLSATVLSDTAFAAMFRRWNIEYAPQPGTEPCRYAAARQLGCANGQGSLAMLLNLDRPALLTLYDSEGRSYPAALIGVMDTDVSLVLGGELKRIPAAALSRWWYGEYLVLWNLPPGYVRPLVKGSSGNAVVWLLQQLGETIDADQPSRDFSEQLEQRVKLFQRSHGLIPDGVVGPLTIIALNNAAHAGSPRLTGPVKE